METHKVGKVLHQDPETEFFKTAISSSPRDEKSSFIASAADAIELQGKQALSPRSKKINASGKLSPVSIKVELCADNPLQKRSSPRDVKKDHRSVQEGEQKEAPDDLFDSYLNQLVRELADEELNQLMLKLADDEIFTNVNTEQAKVDFENYKELKAKEKSVGSEEGINRKVSLLKLRPTEYSLKHTIRQHVTPTHQNIITVFEHCTAVGGNPNKDNLTKWSPRENTISWRHARSIPHINTNAIVIATHAKKNPQYIFEGTESDNYLHSLKKKHHNLDSYLKDGWETVQKPKVSEMVIEDQIDSYVENSISDYFRNPNNTFEDFFSNDILMMKPLIEFIKNDGIAVEQIYIRAKILNKFVDYFHHHEKSTANWENHLGTYLKKLISIDPQSKHDLSLKTGKEIDKFIQIYDEIIELHKKTNTSKSAHIQKWILSAYGDTPEEIDAVLVLLRKWLSIKNSIEDDLYSDLWTKSWKIARIEYLWENFTKIVFNWFQDPKINAMNISKITTREIARCIKPEQINSILFSLITINGNKLWNADEFDEKKEAIDNKQFYSAFFAACEGASVSHKHEEQAMFFIAATHEDCYNVPEVTDKYVPWLPLMRLMSNSNWGYADQYLKCLIPGIFDLPYWTKCEQGIECHIKVEKDSYRVTQVKKMAIFLRQNPEDKTSYLTGDVQVRFRLCWEVQPYNGGWKGRLWIRDYELVAEEHWHEIKQRLVDIKDMYLIRDKIAAKEFSISYPFSKKEQELMHL